MEGRTVNLKRWFRGMFFLLACILLVTMVWVNLSSAATSKEIDTSVDVVLEQLRTKVRGGEEFLKATKGVLVLPRVIKAGFIVGGEYGEGALRIRGKTVDYYSIAAGSFGAQIGAQQKNVVLIFMEEVAVKWFRASSGWKAGVDGSVTVINIGVAGSLDTTNMKDPIIAYVFGQRGLMVNVTLEGAKFTRLKK